MGALSAAIKTSALFNRVDRERGKVRLSTNRSQSLESISVVGGDGALLVTMELGEEWQLDVSADVYWGDESTVGEP